MGSWSDDNIQQIRGLDYPLVCFCCYCCHCCYVTVAVAPVASTVAFPAADAVAAALVADAGAVVAENKFTFFSNMGTRLWGSLRST